MRNFQTDLETLDLVMDGSASRRPIVSITTDVLKGGVTVGNPYTGPHRCEGCVITEEGVTLTVAKTGLPDFEVRITEITVNKGRCQNQFELPDAPDEPGCVQRHPCFLQIECLVAVMNYNYTADDVFGKGEAGSQDRTVDVPSTDATQDYAQNPRTGSPDRYIASLAQTIDIPCDGKSYIAKFTVQIGAGGIHNGKATYTFTGLTCTECDLEALQ